MKVRKLSAIAGAAALLAVLFTGAGTAPATAAPIEGSCGFAEDGTGGRFPESICWFDFAGYDQSAGLSSEGQQFETTLGAYDIAYTVRQRPVPGWTQRGVDARMSTDPAFPMGNWDYYDGIPGRPYLYALSGGAFGAVQISITDFRVSLDGVPVAGYDLVSAAPETPDAPVGRFGEWVYWSSDRPLTLIDSTPTMTSGGGCTVPFPGNGTIETRCDPAPAGTPSVFGPLLAAPSATTISGTLYMSSQGEREALAFGIRTATLSVEKQVDGRVDPLDSFDLSVRAPEGSELATATTGTAADAAIDRTIVIPSGTFTVEEIATAGAPSPLGYYDADWVCSNSAPESGTVLPSGASSAQTIALAAGDSVDCTVTNTPRSASLAVEKTVSPVSAGVGDTVEYAFAVTNDGELPVEDLEIREDAFSGAGALGPIVCPVTTLDPGASTTCLASYVVVQADVDAGSVSNRASAIAGVAGTTAVAESATSTALLASPGTAGLRVTKLADADTAHVGDEVTFTLTAANTGSVTLSDVILTDEDFSGHGPLEALACDRDAPVVLAPGALLTCTVTYSAVTADIGTISNSAIGSAVDPQGAGINDESSVEVDVVAAPPGSAAQTATLAITGAAAPFLLAAFGVAVVLAGAFLAAARRRVSRR